MARFHVRDGFAIRDRAFYVLAGFAIEGEVTARMLVRIPFQATTMLTAQIDHIEQVHRPDDDVVCLCIRCANPEEVKLWSALNLTDRIVEVVEQQA